MNNNPFGSLFFMAHITGIKDGYFNVYEKDGERRIGPCAAQREVSEIRAETAKSLGNKHLYRIRVKRR